MKTQNSDALISTNIIYTTTMNNTNYFTKRAVCFKRGLDNINYGQITMTNNTEYYIKRAVCYKRGLDNINYGQTGLATTDTSTGEGHCWFLPDGAVTFHAIRLETKFVFFGDTGYTNGTEI